MRKVFFTRISIDISYYNIVFYNKVIQRHIIILTHIFKRYKMY